MNLTRERWGGKRASTRTGRREATLEQLISLRLTSFLSASARVQTLELATRHACAEAKRRERPLVYEVRGHRAARCAYRRAWAVGWPARRTCRRVRECS